MNAWLKSLQLNVCCSKSLRKQGHRRPAVEEVPDILRTNRRLITDEVDFFSENIQKGQGADLGSGFYPVSGKVGRGRRYSAKKPAASALPLMLGIAFPKLKGSG